MKSGHPIGLLLVVLLVAARSESAARARPTLDRRTETLQGIEVSGNAEFIARTREALLILSKARHLQETRKYIAVIRQARRSGMRAYDARPTYEVGEKTWRHSSMWFASSIAHDTCHSMLYQQAKIKNRKREPDPNAWTGLQAERRCLALQLKVLQDARADQGLIDYVKGLQANPTYQGNNRSWSQYERRSW